MENISRSSGSDNVSFGYGLPPNVRQSSLDGPRSSSGGMSPRDWMAMRAAERREEAAKAREEEKSGDRWDGLS